MSNSSNFSNTTTNIFSDIATGANKEKDNVVNNSSKPNGNTENPFYNNKHSNTYKNGQPPKKKKKVVITIIVVAVVLSVIYYLYSSYFSDEKPRNEYVATLSISGEIGMSSDSVIDGSTGTNPYFYLDTIDGLSKDPKNKAILLYIDTPGGSAYWSDRIYCALMKYRETTERPVFAYIESEGCSGGYYIANAANRIFSDRNAMIGSVGVTFGTFFDVSSFLSKNGIRTNTITSAKYKDIGSSFKHMSRNERKILQNLINDAEDQFIEIVAKGRHVSKNVVKKKYATGAIWSAKDAKAKGLIDYVSTLDELYEYIDVELNNEYEFCDFYEPEPSFFDLIFESINNLVKKSDSSDLSKVLEMVKSRHNKIYYLYEG